MAPLRLVLLFATLTTSSAATIIATRRGLTSGRINHKNGVDELSCINDLASCDSHVGDTDCAIALPILCINQDGATDPGITHWWARGNIALTTNVKGSDLTSLSVANALCSSQLGAGWRMAEWHEGSDGSFSAYGNVRSDTRFWTAINNQNANCWDGVWSAWTDCSVFCGGGVQNRVRSCSSTVSLDDGSICSPGETSDRQSCNTNPCSVNGVWSVWSAWSTCSASCGGGLRSRNRSCSDPNPALGGMNCSTAGASSEQQSCGTNSCPAAKNGLTFGRIKHTDGVDMLSCTNDLASCDPYVGDTNCATALPILCINQDGSPDPGVSPWWASGNIALTTDVKGSDLTSLSVANALCSSQLGTDWRMAEWHDYSGGFGFSAYGNVRSDTRFWTAINDQNANCWDVGWSEWSAWTSCSASCGGGVQNRTRNCIYLTQANEEAPCPENDISSQEQSCNATTTCSKGVAGSPTPPLSPLDAYDSLNAMKLLDGNGSTCINGTHSAMQRYWINPLSAGRNSTFNVTLSGQKLRCNSTSALGSYAVTTFRESLDSSGTARYDDERKCRLLTGTSQSCGFECNCQGSSCSLLALWYIGCGFPDGTLCEIVKL